MNKILIVEDEIAISDLIKIALEICGSGKCKKMNELDMCLEEYIEYRKK